MTFSNSPSPGVTLQGGGGSGGAGASAPLTGTGAIVTTSQPLIDVSQTWNNAAVTFTSLKLNITDTASNAASLLMDLGTGGGSFVSRFNVDKTGNISSLGYFATNASQAWISSANNANARLNTSGLKLAANTLFGWTTTANESNAALDLILTRRGAANLRLGAADAAAPVAQTLSVQSVVAGTTNTAGTNLTITGSQGTGTGAGGSLIFQVAPAGSSGSAQNALATALTIDTTGLSTFTNGTNRVVVDVTSTSSMAIRAYQAAFTVGSIAFNASTNNVVITPYNNTLTLIAGGVQIGQAGAVAVASLPAGPTGTIHRVNNALAPTVGTTVAGGGAAQALCWYNGANWTVIGV